MNLIGRVYISSSPYKIFDVTISREGFVENEAFIELKKFIKQPLNGLRIAPHYGCHYIKPSDIYEGFDSPFHPHSLDKLIEITGATSLQYSEKLQCCGGGILADHRRIAGSNKADLVFQIGRDREHPGQESGSV
jgi:heterodisulfide reductase subunit B